MNTTSHVPASPKDRTTKLSRSARQIIDTLESATPEERAKLIRDNRAQLEVLSLMLDGLRYRGTLADQSDVTATDE